MEPRKNLNHSSKNDVSGVNHFIDFRPLKRTLERDFFSDATIDVHSSNASTIELVIHLDCNFGLTESLFHLNNGNWGNFSRRISGGIKTSPFQTILLELEQSYSAINIYIKELSIHLRDTSIIITKLPNRCIQDHLECILDAVSANFVYFTKGLTAMPYEIFVPIYEETANSLNPTEKQNKRMPNYLEFWGLYFEGEDDSSVYDVKNKVIISESNFFLLNQWG